MRKQPSINQFKEVIKSLKEQGAVDDDAYAALTIQLNKLAHGLAVKNQVEVVRAVSKISKILWEITR